MSQIDLVYLIRLGDNHPIMDKVPCPGQELRPWSPDDVFEAPCVKCGKSIEFFERDASVDCPSCGAENVNLKYQKSDNESSSTSCGVKKHP
jgi:predicted RNA-binding Zn-ribbon protein involved in translation (DUF1610 family)